MHNLVVSAPPPNLDSFAPELCHCGKKTVKSHEFWYCSTSCAREDSLRSLGNNQCHYRENVRKAHALAGVQGSHLRRIMSINHLRRAASERRFNAPHVPSPKNLPQKKPTLACRDTRDRNMAGLPALTQVTGKILVHKANAGEALVAARQDLHQWEGHPIAPSCTRPVEACQGHTFAQISLDAIPFSESDPPRSPRRVPQMTNGPKSSIRKSITALLAVGRSRKGRDGENSEKIFGHPVSAFVPPVRKESLPSRHQKNPPSAKPMSSSRTLRRSASFAGWDTPLHGCLSSQDPLVHIIEELRAEVSENFDPRSLFELNEVY